jgi:hypothetical protein
VSNRASRNSKSGHPHSKWGLKKPINALRLGRHGAPRYDVLHEKSSCNLADGAKKSEADYMKTMPATRLKRPPGLAGAGGVEKPQKTESTFHCGLEPAADIVPDD